jgi:hypothetical protein
LRFFVDEQVLGLAHALAAARADTVHPGHWALPSVPLGTADIDWMREVGGTHGHDLVVITRDKRIKRRSAEAETLRDEGVRAFFLTGKNDMNNWDLLQVVVARWKNMEKHINNNGAGPWTMSVPMSGSARDIHLW